MENCQGINQTPPNYPVCLNMECTKRDRCLHALSTGEQHLAASSVICINPLRYSGSQPCSEYRDKDAIARYAFGMKGLANSLKIQHLYRSFMAECRKHYCRTVFYDMYAGKRTITPEDQSVLLSCARSIGATLSDDCFDEVVEGTAW